MKFLFVKFNGWKSLKASSLKKFTLETAKSKMNFLFIHKNIYNKCNNAKIEIYFRRTSLDISVKWQKKHHRENVWQGKYRHRSDIPTVSLPVAVSPVGSVKKSGVIAI